MLPNFWQFSGLAVTSVWLVLSCMQLTLTYVLISAVSLLPSWTLSSLPFSPFMRSEITWRVSKYSGRPYTLRSTDYSTWGGVSSLPYPCTPRALKTFSKVSPWGRESVLSQKSIRGETTYLICLTVMGALNVRREIKVFRSFHLPSVLFQFHE